MPLPDRLAAAIMKKAAPAKTEEIDVEEKEPKEESTTSEGMKAACEDIMAALGQDYGSSPHAEKGQRQRFEDQRDRLCKALCAFFDCCDTGGGPADDQD